MRDKAVLYQCHKLIFEEGESLIFNHWRTDCRRWNKSLPKSSALFYISIVVNFFLHWKDPWPEMKAFLSISISNSFPPAELPVVWNFRMHINDANHQINDADDRFPVFCFCLFPGLEKAQRLNFPQKLTTRMGCCHISEVWNFNLFQAQGEIPVALGQHIGRSNLRNLPFAKTNPSLKGQIFHGKRLKKHGLVATADRSLQPTIYHPSLRLV